jgi:hypothetical protein
MVATERDPIGRLLSPLAERRTAADPPGRITPAAAYLLRGSPSFTGLSNGLRTEEQRSGAEFLRALRAEQPRHAGTVAAHAARLTPKHRERSNRPAL